MTDHEPKVAGRQLDERQRRYQRKRGKAPRRTARNLIMTKGLTVAGSDSPPLIQSVAAFHANQHENRDAYLRSNHFSSYFSRIYQLGGRRGDPFPASESHYRAPV
jgi:hypothetical protein